MNTYLDDLREDCLYHHGIKGQRWGVRRFQDKNGRLNAAGKARYSSNIDVKHANELADKLYSKAAEIEPRVTNDVLKAFQASGSAPYGLGHRLKTKESLSRKLLTDSKEKNQSIEETAKSINDYLRYTSLASDDNFVSSYNSVKKILASKGYVEERCKNYFELYRQGKAKHKQVTSVYSDRDGNLFEIQFLTPSAKKAKELKTPLYEEVRNPMVSIKRKSEILTAMEKLASNVSDPVGVYEIRSH